MTLDRLKRTLVHNALDPNAVDDAVVEEQLTTAAALRERLDEHGGVILGDEVGAGKTFVTFAVLADTLLREPGRGAVIFVPSDPLGRKWAQQLGDYLRIAVNDRASGHALADRVVTMNRSMYVPVGDRWRRPKRDDIVITQHRTFSGQVAEWDRGRCVERWLDLRCPRDRKPRKKFFAACGVDRDRLGEEWASWSSWARDDVLTSRVLKPLDRVFEEWDRGARDLRGGMRDAVLDVRREVGRNVLPDAALVVVDEAHNLRSATSQVYQSLMYVLSGRFDAMLFLTATPFQLGREELRRVVEFFRSARPVESRSGAFDDRVARMEAGMNGYVSALASFGAAWRDLEPGEAEAATTGNGGPTSPRTRAAVESFERALAAKRDLETGLRPFIVRTVRDRHHVERCGVRWVPPESRVPVALVDRLISERLAQRDRTFIASALTSACSSWESLFAASVMTKEAEGATLGALTAMQSGDLLGPHPKLADTIAACRAGIEVGEKTLVFVERNQTGKALKDSVERELGEGHDRSAYQRLQDPKRFGWPSLRENYLHTLYPDAFGKVPSPRECVRAVSTNHAVDLWDRADVDGPLNYKVVKRVIEHALFHTAAERDPEWIDRVASDEVRSGVENLLEEDYVVNGLDLLSGDSNTRHHVPQSPTRTGDREISDAFVRAYAAYQSPWATSVAWLRDLGPGPRADLVDAAAAAIASSHLQTEVVQQEADGDAAAHFSRMGTLLGQDRWRERFEAIANQAADLVASDRTDAAERITRLAQALRHGERVLFVNGETANDTKERAINGFNTPLYPEVLIATGVLAEGVDLHRSCRRVIHHDLPWNPAKLEQRTGRVDRIGSLSARLKQKVGDTDASAVDVGLPFVAGTYDETIFRRVLARRREFRCLLGNRPEWDQDEIGGDGSEPFPEAMVEALQADLAPRAGRARG